MKASAQRSGVAGSTAFRWRHRFLRAVTAGAIKLRGIVEADETFVLSSRKGERNLDRKARKRGGKASKRGLSDEQVPVLVAADRSGVTVSAVLPAVSAAHLQAVLQPVLDQDALLVTDGCPSYLPCAAALGVSHEALNQTAGERVRGELHIQTVNSRHERLKTFLRHHRGVATKYLDSYSGIPWTSEKSFDRIGSIDSSCLVKTNRNFLSAADRADLVKIVRDGLEEHRIVRRANAILLLDKGWSYAEVAEALFLGDSTVRAWLKEFQEGGVEAIVLFDLKGGIGRLWPLQIDELRAWATEVLPTTTTEIGQFILERFGFDYGRSGLNPIERLWKVMHENVTHNRCYAKFRDFAEAVLGFLRKTVPQRFDEFSSTITDNFRVIDPKEFRILA